ncbi:MAG: glycosyltransferase family 2 protein [Phycisphaerae bacterium]
MIDASIVIVSYNTRELLRDCLIALGPACTSLSAEIFVVDNASGDGSADMVQREFPAALLIRNEHNCGFASANNAAIDRASGRYVVLLNPDTKAAPGAITEMVRFMDENPSVGYCGPRLANADGTHQPSARRFPTVLSAAYCMLGLSRRFPNSRHTLDLHLSNGDRRDFRADWLCGACLMVRKDCIRQVGTLDEGFFMYFEETDWCRRIATARWQGRYLASPEVVHFGGQSICEVDGVAPFSGDHPAHWTRSRRRYMRRYYGVAGVIISDAVQIILYSLIWLRHRWRPSDSSRAKARTAAAAVRYFFT